MLICTSTDAHKHLRLPPTIHPNPKPGHLHFHRNRYMDTVTVWMLDASNTWIDCTSIYARRTRNPIKHPHHPHLVLSTRSDFNWAPLFITEANYNRRRHLLGSLKFPLVQRVEVLAANVT
jgi:hypothetical protein